MSTPYERRKFHGDGPQPMPVSGLHVSIPADRRPSPGVHSDGQPRRVGTKEATRKPSTKTLKPTLPARPTPDSAAPQPNVPAPNPSATKPKGKYSLRITFLSPMIRDFTALRDRLLKLSPPIKSVAMDTIIGELQPLLERPVKSELIDLIWEIKMRLNKMLSSMLKELDKFDKTSKSRQYKDDEAYRKQEQNKTRKILEKDMVSLEQILPSSFAKKKSKRTCGVE